MPNVTMAESRGSPVKLYMPSQVRQPAAAERTMPVKPSNAKRQLEKIVSSMAALRRRAIRVRRRRATVHAMKTAIPIGRAFSASLSIRNLTSILKSFPASASGESAAAWLIIARPSGPIGGEIETKCALWMNFF